MGLPLSVIRKLAMRSLTRKLMSMRQQADVMRVAQHADQQQYQDYVTSLNVDTEAEHTKPDDGAINTKFFGVVNG